ncbi:hypothetical protein D3C72_2392540 [compost metagenome]
MIRQIQRHDVGRSQRLTGVGQQGFDIEFRVDDEHAAEFAWGGLNVGSRGDAVVGIVRFGIFR